MSSILETTLATRYEPGTNLKRRSTRAGWLHLLPSLDLAGVICIGVPGKWTLATLARRARRVAVACVVRHDFRERHRARGTPGLEQVEWLDGRDARAVSEAAVWGDLLILVGRRGRRWLTKGGERVNALQRILAQGGLVYLEYSGLGKAAPGGSEEWAKLRRLGAVRSFRLLPLWGEPQVAVPGGDRVTLDYFIQSGLVRPWSWPGVPGPVAKFLRWVPGPSAFGRRHGVLVGGSASRPATRPPEYLCAIASQSRVSLEDYRWGLSIPSIAYPSRKLIFCLFGPRSSCPSYVVKLVSDPSLNRRLENEARALRELEALGMTDGGRMPRVAFSGLHAGLALVGETLIEGVPFRKKSEGGPTCPYAGAAVDGLLELGRLSRVAAAATGPEVASAVRRLLSRFSELYGDGEIVEFLQARVDALGRHPDPIPLVFQHGDPGIWNLLATPTGQVAFLDWEAADAAGLPLWDLLYLLRSFGVLSARRRGAHVALRAFELTFLDDSDLARWVRRAIARYCEAVGVAKPLIEALFYTCWMHRSVKEATRLRPRELNSGHYVNVLRLCIRERSRESLARLFTLSA